MRRIVFAMLPLLIAGLASAQTTDTTASAAPRVTLPKQGRTGNDFIMLQLGHTIWDGKPDSINTKGWSRSFNAYIMLDFPFRTNTHFSVALGPGISAESMFFDKMTVGIKENTSTLNFTDVSDTNYFKKYKLVTAFLELPIELRYSADPDNPNRGFKFAVGAKIGTMVNAHVKGKELRNRSGNTISDYILKENSKRFFNKNRLSVMARIGYGRFSAFGTYSITPLFREGLGPEVRPITIGLALSGL